MWKSSSFVRRGPRETLAVGEAVERCWCNRSLDRCTKASDSRLRLAVVLLECPKLILMSYPDYRCRSKLFTI